MNKIGLYLNHTVNKYETYWKIIITSSLKVIERHKSVIINNIKDVISINICGR